MKKVTCVVVGDAGVGKSTIITQLTQSVFEEDYKPTVEDEATFPLLVGDHDVELTIYDTSGNVEFARMREDKYKLGEGFLAVYSITSDESFKELKTILDKLKALKENTVPIVLVGCKLDSDEQRQVTTEQGAEMAKLLNCPFAEINAKERDHVVDVFTRLVREIERISSQHKVETTPAAAAKGKPKKKKCCTVL
ncbi:unnamed protein product [Candidula unifasciata]|uniref:Uncharacterized protein n=1 Tax=Candidula unifasciata TaxID=100452 RepID=A0A8S3YT38_9EUPU|nr:unnamed protein product [Candidula unifasciata]